MTPLPSQYDLTKRGMKTSNSSMMLTANDPPGSSNQMKNSNNEKKESYIKSDKVQTHRSSFV